jgi:hypothetical protein
MVNILGNRSHAVVAQRHEKQESLDDFPTPPWATRALIEHVIGKERVVDCNVWEPAVNRGFMSRPLQEYFKVVAESDIYDYGQRAICDFLDADNTDGLFNWIITNPPFNKAQQFVEKSQRIATDGVAMLVRTSFLEGVMRYQTMYLKNPPDIVAQFSERVPMVKGRIDKKASTATSYAWLVWYIDPHPDVDKQTILRWIPPCRKQLEREGDYDC